MNLIDEDVGDEEEEEGQKWDVIPVVDSNEQNRTKMFHSFVEED